MTALGLGLGGSLGPAGLHSGTTATLKYSGSSHGLAFGAGIAKLGMPVTSITAFTAAQTASLTQGVGMASVPAITALGVVVAQGVGTTLAQMQYMRFAAAASADFRFEGLDEVVKRYNLAETQGVGVDDVTPTYAFRPGAVVAEVIRIQQASSPAFRYTWTETEQVYVAEALSMAIPRSLTQGIAVAQAFSVSLAITTLQGLGIVSTPLPSLRYTQALVQALTVDDDLARFLGGSLSQGVGVNQGQSVQYRPQPALSQGVGLNDTLANKLILRVTSAQGIGIDPGEALKMIYNGTLSDEVEIVAGYVSPSGQFTTWAINTRSGAVSEYSNYAFNSFARVGNKYLGASSNGLYELLGSNDDGTSIITQIKSGFAQWAGSRFTMFKAAYLGIHGSGNFTLKIVTADGKTYIYSVAARDMRTTKVRIGKGIRTRYFSFELISTGQDFDLDTIEFVPLVAERRV